MVGDIARFLYFLRLRDTPWWTPHVWRTCANRRDESHVRIEEKEGRTDMWVRASIIRNGYDNYTTCMYSWGWTLDTTIKTDARWCQHESQIELGG